MNYVQYVDDVYVFDMITDHITYFLFWFRYFWGFPEEKISLVRFSVDPTALISKCICDCLQLLG